MKKMKKLLSLVLAGVMAVSLAACGGSSGSSAPSENGASTTDWPKETITLIVPASAGGGTDLMARLWAQYASEKLGVSVVVSNVTGSGGSTGIQQAHDAKNDGYTALFFHNNVVINYLSGLTSFDHTGFEVGPEFAYDDPCALFVKADNKYGWKSLSDVIATAKENPGTITVATEIGSYTYFELLSIQQATGAEFAITDGGSNSEKITGLLGGAFDVMLNAYSTAGSYAESGEFLCLGIPTEERSSICPNVATFKEQGIDMIYDGYYFSLFFPEGTDQAIVDKIDAVTKEICEDENVIAKIQEMNYQIKNVSAADNKVQFDNLETYYKDLGIQ